MGIRGMGEGEKDRTGESFGNRAEQYGRHASPKCGKYTSMRSRFDDRNRQKLAATFPERLNDFGRRYRIALWREKSRLSVPRSLSSIDPLVLSLLAFAAVSSGGPRSRFFPILPLISQYFPNTSPYLRSLSSSCHLLWRILPSKQFFAARKSRS